MTITIAIDAMGGDVGPEVTVPAAITVLKQKKDLKLIMVGRESLINDALAKHGRSRRLTVYPASQIVEMDDLPAHALRRKKNSSMRVAIDLVKSGEADACVSAGNTGALMATARFVLKTLQDISRPAICTALPTRTSHVHMLDLGANVDSPPEMLLQFAVMGSVLSRYVDGIESPSIGLLNVGVEDIKGNETVKRAAELISHSRLNYQGYIEADEIYFDKVDVVVCDGFAGNVSLKTSEGVARLISTIVNEEFRRRWWRKVIGLMSQFVLKAVHARVDPRQYNGATLLGLRGIVIKSHGNTDVLGFSHAILEAAKQAEIRLPEHIGAEVSGLIKNLESQEPGA